MMPQEVREMSPDKLVLITEGTRPIMANKIRYFKDSTLSARVKFEKAPVPALNLDPKFSPSLEDIAGAEVAAKIRSGNKGGHPAGAGAKAPSPQKDKPGFDGMLKVIKGRKPPES